MKSIILVLAIFVMVFIGCKNQQELSLEKMRGMYALDKFEMLNTQTGEWIPEPSRDGYSGYILYDGLGHMGVHITPKGYKDFDVRKKIDSADNQELKALATFYQSNFVYFGDYDIKDSVINHKRLSTTDPGEWGTTLTRNVEFRGDTLILTPHEKISGMQLRLRWVRLK